MLFSKDKNSTCNRERIEVIDITEEDRDDVINISDDETTVSSKLPADRITEETTIALLSDGEDEVLLSTSPRKFAEPISEPTTPVEVPITDQVDVSFNENKIDPTIEIDEKPPKEENEPKFIDVTSSMNGLLMKSSPFEYPKALQNILDYSSDEENYSFYDDSNNLSVTEDVKFDQKEVKLCLSAEKVQDVKITPIPEITRNIKVELDSSIDEDLKENLYLELPTPAKVVEGHEGLLKPKQDPNNYKSPLSVFSELYDENDENDVESDDSSFSASDAKPITPIIHRTLLTNKIAKITEIPALPMKTRRKKRVRSESPESIFQRLSNAERIHKSSLSPPPLKLKNSSHESEKTSPSTALCVTKSKKIGRPRSVPSTQSAVKQAREKVKALYPAPPEKIQRTPKTRTTPKVKVTDKNRGDFLTKLQLPCHRSPAKVVEAKPNGVISSEPISTTEPEEPTNNISLPNEPETLISPPQIEPDPNLVTNNEHRRSIDEILDTIEVPTIAIDDGLSEIVPPPVITSRTIEVSVNFTKTPPLKLPVSNSNSKLIGESILKKSANEAQPSGEKKRVTFPREIATDFMHVDDDHSRLSFSTMMNRIWPKAECHNCGGNGHSTKRCTKDPVCYNCFRTGHIAIACKRPILCFNCKGTGHKGSDCPLPDIRLNGSQSEEQPFKSHNRDYDKTFNENMKRMRIRDPRLRSIINQSI